MITKRAVTELEHLRALHVSTFLLCMWVPLLPSVSKRRVVFFTGVPLILSCGPGRIIDNIPLPSSPPPISSKR